jgi:hypothetical protein
MLFHLASTGKLMNILENLGPQLLPLDIEVIMMHTQSKVTYLLTLILTHLLTLILTHLLTYALVTAGCGRCFAPF